MRQKIVTMNSAPQRREGRQKLLQAGKGGASVPLCLCASAVFLCALCVFAVMASGGMAAEIHEMAGTTSFAFLKLVSGARATAMGGAFVAMDGDVNGMASNPASLATIRVRQGTATYTNYLVDTQFGMVGAAQPLSDVSTFGVMLSYMSYGELQGTDEHGQPEGTFGASDMVLQGVLAQYVVQSLAVGIGVKAIYSSIEDYSSDAYVMDLGVRFRPPIKGLSLGASLTNVGFVRSGFSEDFKDALPVAARVGFAHQVAHLPLLFVGEVVLPNDNDVYFCGGAEIRIRDILFLRGGYNSLLKDLNEDDWAGVALGCGFRWTQYRLDYAYSFFAELKEAHRVSVVGEF